MGHNAKLVLQMLIENLNLKQHFHIESFFSQLSSQVKS